MSEDREAQGKTERKLSSQEQPPYEASRVMGTLINDILPTLLDNPDPHDEAKKSLRQQLAGVVGRLTADDSLREAVADRLWVDIRGIRGEIKRIGNLPPTLTESHAASRRDTLNRLQKQLEPVLAGLAITETLGATKTK